MLTDVQAPQTSGPAGLRSTRRCQLTSLCCQQRWAQPVSGQLPPLPDPPGSSHLQAPAPQMADATQMASLYFGGAGGIFQAGCLDPAKWGVMEECVSVCSQKCAGWQ